MQQFESDQVAHAGDGAGDPRRPLTQSARR
jgi:hypothetical protein